jgi:ABC-type phosphate/phosphonate transport system ATPase subunit
MQRNYTRFHLEARYQSTKYYSLEDQVEVSIFGASDSGKTTILKQVCLGLYFDLSLY